jgi:hypothetical protein
MTAHRWTREEYERMAAEGLFAPDARVELIDGIVYNMSPQKGPYASAVHRGLRSLQSVFPDRHIRVQAPLALSDDSEPEPDLAVVPGKLEDPPLRPLRDSGSVAAERPGEDSGGPPRPQRRPLPEPSDPPDRRYGLSTRPSGSPDCCGRPVPTVATSELCGTTIRLCRLSLRQPFRRLYCADQPCNCAGDPFPRAGSLSDCACGVIPWRGKALFVHLP